MEPRNPDYRASVEAGFAGGGFGQDAGIRLVDCGPGWVTSEVVIEPRHLQQNGVVHGGLMATMADHTAGAAAVTLAAAGQIGMTAELKVSMLRAARAPRLECRGQVLKQGRSLSFVEAEVYAVDGERRELVAKASATMAISSTR